MQKLISPGPIELDSFWPISSLGEAVETVGAVALENVGALEQFWTN